MKQDAHAVANEDNDNETLFLSVIQYQFNRVISPRSEIVRAHPQGCRSTSSCSVKGKMITKLSEGKTIIHYNFRGVVFNLDQNFVKKLLRKF